MCFFHFLKDSFSGLCLILLSILLPFTARSQPPQIKLSTGITLAPYHLPNSEKGLEFDIIKEASANAGYEITFLKASNARSLILLKQQKVEGTITACQKIPPPVYFSTPILYFRNVAITLSSKDIHLNTIQDLSHYRVLAFQLAAKTLPSQYEKVTAQNPLYEEVPKQRVQIYHLYENRTDVLIMDQNIFYYYRKQFRHLTNVKQPITIVPLFPPSPRKIAFHRKHLRDIFDKALLRLKRTGRYTEIRRSYM